MTLKDYLNTWEGLKSEAKITRIVLVSLAIALAAVSFYLVNKQEIVVLQPVTLGADAWITENKSSQSYKEAWALYLAQLTGNVTPTNLDFIKERLKPLLSPSIYGEVIDAMEMQAQSIKEDRVTMRFEPRSVHYEETSDRVFVLGKAFIKGALGPEKAETRTYEYQLKISHYLPLITLITTYEGNPRSESVLIRMEQEKMRTEKDNHNA